MQHTRQQRIGTMFYYYTVKSVTFETVKVFFITLKLYFHSLCVCVYTHTIDILIYIIQVSVLFDKNMIQHKMV